MFTILLQTVPAFPTTGEIGAIISWIIGGLVAIVVVLGLIVKHIFTLHMERIQTQIRELAANNDKKDIQIKELNDYVHKQVVPIITHNSECLERNSQLFEKMLGTIINNRDK